MGITKDIVGGDVIEGMYASAPDDEIHFQRYLSANCFGDHRTRTGIDVPTRELLTLAIDYGGVRNVLTAMGARGERIGLMTAIGVTNRTGAYNLATQARDWKRRSQRLMRASGLPHTIVRRGWFDYNAPAEHRLVLLQGDTRQAGNSSDGVIAGRQLAEVLVRSLSSDAALRKTFELVATTGPATDDLDALFARLEAGAAGALDGLLDTANMPLADEPPHVRDDLAAVGS